MAEIHITLNEDSYYKCLTDVGLLDLMAVAHVDRVGDNYHVRLTHKDLEQLLKGEKISPDEYAHELACQLVRQSRPKKTKSYLLSAAVVVWATASVLLLFLAYQ